MYISIYHYINIYTDIYFPGRSTLVNGKSPLPGASPPVYSRCQLRVVDQVLQGVAAAELVQQAGQVADDRCGFRGVEETRDVSNLNEGSVAVGVGSQGRGDL